MGKGILQRMFVVLLLVSLLPLPAMAAPTALQNAPAIFVLPTVVHAGGEPRVTGYNLVPNATYRVDFGIDGVPILPQSSFLTASDSAGEIHTSLSLPYGLEPRPDYTVMVAGPIDNQTDEYYAKFTVLPALDLGLNPVEGPPGTVVEFTVNNLSPGSLRVDFDDATVLGPLPVSGTSYTGVFVVPNGFEPEPEPPVTAVNLVNDVVVGSVRQDFRIDATPQPPTYSLANVEMPTEPVVAGEIFTVTGQITPVPTGRTENYYVVALWENDSGQVIPISQEKARLDATGRFAVAAHLPDFFSGDPYSYANETYNQSHMSLSLVEYNDATKAFDVSKNFEIDLPIIPNVDFDVFVFDIDTGKQIVGALWTIYILDPEVGINYGDNMFPLFDESIRDSFFDWCQSAKGKTDDSGYLRQKYDPSVRYAAAANAAQVAGNSVRAIYGEQAIGNQSMAFIASSTPWQPPTPDWKAFRVRVNGLGQGYGPLDANGNPLFTYYEKDVWFNIRSRELRDVDGKVEETPLKIPLKRLKNLDIEKLVPMQLALDSTISGREGVIPNVNGSWPLYGGFYSFAAVRNESDIVLDLHDRWVDVSFELLWVQGTQIQEASLFFDSKNLGVFEKEWELSVENHCVNR